MGSVLSRFRSWCSRNRDEILMAIIGAVCFAMPFVGHKVHDIPIETGWYWFVFAGLFWFGRCLKALAKRTGWKIWWHLRDLIEATLGWAGLLIAFFVANYGFVFLIITLMWLAPILVLGRGPSLALTIYSSLSLGFLMNVYLHGPVQRLMIRIAGRNDDMTKRIITRFYSRQIVPIYIYASYLLMIIAYNVMEFENIYPQDWSLRANKAVLQSFVTFVAAERVVRYYLDNLRK